MKQLIVVCTLLYSVMILAQVPKDTLKIGYTSAPPFLIKKDTQLQGINVWLWEAIANDLGLVYKYVPMEFGDMLTAIESGAIDVCINPLTVTSKRSERFNFTSPFYVANATIAVNKPSVFKQLLDVTKNFFNLDFLRGLFLLVLIIVLFGVLGWYFERRANPDFRKSSKGIWDGLWWSVVTITTVGYGDKSPKTKSGKLIALMLMFVGLLFISGLTASIASSLTVNQIGSNTSDYTSFKNKKVGTVNGTSVETFLKQNFFSDVIGFAGVTEGLTALNKNEIEVFIYDEPILKYKMKKDPAFDRLNVLPIKFDVQFYAFGISKEQHDLQHLISKQILMIIESKEWEIVLNEYGLTEI